MRVVVVVAVVIRSVMIGRRIEVERDRGGEEEELWLWLWRTS
jgi:hypothetical protein